MHHSVARDACQRVFGVEMNTSSLCRSGTNLSGGVDMADIGSDTGGTTDIEEGELSDKGVLLEEEGEGLSNSP